MLRRDNAKRDRAGARSATRRLGLVRQAAPQRRTGALEPTRPRRPGVEPRHKLRTEINVVKGSAKLVYVSIWPHVAVAQAVPKVLGISNSLGDSFPTLDGPQTPCAGGKSILQWVAGFGLVICDTRL